MIVTRLFCYDCHLRHEGSAHPSEGSDAIFYPMTEFDPSGTERCPRCCGERVSVEVMPADRNRKGGGRDGT